MRLGARIGFALLIVVGLAGTSSGKTDPTVACAAFELKTTGATASAMLGCHALAAQKGLVTDADCLAAAAGKLAAAFAKAEAVATKAGGACPLGSDADAVEAAIDAFVGTAVTALRPESSASKCAAKKLASVGKHAQKLLGAHAANDVKPDGAKFEDKVAKAEAALAATFAKLDAKGKDCQTTSDELGMADAAERLVVTQVCDDRNRCTTDGIAGLVCQHTPISCADHYACDFRTGSCAYTDCCLMSGGTGLCVVAIPVAQLPTSQTFCQSYGTAHTNLRLINYGSQCIGWRANGAGDCP